MVEETVPAVEVLEALSTGHTVVEFVCDASRFSGIHLAPGESYDISVVLRVRGVEKV